MTLTGILQRHRWLFLVFAVITPLMLAWSWNEQIGEIGSDATDYLVMARHYSPAAWSTGADASTAALTRFPPVYPLLLALTGGASDLHNAHALTTTLLLLALVVFYLWLQAEEVPPSASALFVLGFALLPDSWMAGLVIHSEYAYLLLSLAAILLLRCSRRDPSGTTLVAAAVAAGLAALTRTIGIALFVPMLLEAARLRNRRSLFAVLIFGCLFAEWHLLHHADQSYGRALQSIYGNDAFDAAIRQITTQLQAYRLVIYDDFGHQWLPMAVTDLLGLICLVAMFRRLVQLHADAVYLITYAAILLLWPYPEVAHRLLWPALPLLLAQPILVATDWVAQPQRSLVAGTGIAVVVVIILLQGLPGLHLASQRYQDAVDWPQLPQAEQFEGWYNPDMAHAIHRVNSQLVTIEALKAIPAFVPENDCVIAARPVIVVYFGGRRAVFPPLNSVSDPQFMQAVHATGCHYVFMYNATDGHFPVPLHPLERLPRPVRIVDEHRQADPVSGEGEMICMLARID